MKTLGILRFAALSVLTLSLSAFGISGPDHLSLRPLAMGNAFVAVVDDQNALYYNTAGLNLINALGNEQQRPDMANYPRDPMNLSLDFEANASPYELLSFFRLYQKNRHDSDVTTIVGADSGTYTRGVPIPLGIGTGTQLAVHDFGMAAWSSVEVSPYDDQGILFPQAGVQNLQVDAVIQIAGAHGFLDDKLALGAGYVLANRQEVENYQVNSAEFDTSTNSKSVHNTLRRLINGLEDTLRTKGHNYEDFGSYGNGLDLGALWQQTSEVRFGASLENLGMFLNGVAVVPKLTTGVDYAPSLLCSGGRLSRKVNVALDLEDLLNSDRNYKFLSKVDMGAEVQQDLWWLMSVRLACGFKGGYFTAGGGLSLLSGLHIDAATWADEAGYYTGQIEQRYYAVTIGVGFNP